VALLGNVFDACGMLCLPDVEYVFKIARNTVVEILFSFNQIYKRRSTQLLNIDQK